jgi:energy-coupling factor transport system permease protein
MTNIVLGRYVPISTPIHRIDPRVKLISFIVMLVAVFLNYGTNYQNFIMYGIFFLILLTIVLIGKISLFSILKSVSALWFMMVILLILNAFLVQTGNVLFKIGNFEFYDEGLYRTIYIVIRLVLMVIITSILTSTTKPMELTFALEWLLSFLAFCKGMKIAIHIFAMTLSLALRFIPTLADEANRIIQAQASRGVDFKNGRLKDRFKGLVSLIIPLFVSCLSKSSELADAMDARGYNPLGKRTRYNRRKWTIGDTIYTIFSLGFLAGMICLSIYKIEFIDLIRGLING